MRTRLVIVSADSNYHSEENLKTCAQEQLDIDIPDPHFHARDLRFATQDRHQPHADEWFTLGDFAYDKAHHCYQGPNGKVLPLDVRRHKIGHNIYRRYEANEADCEACLLREQGVQNAETRRNIWPSMLSQPRRPCHSR